MNVSASDSVLLFMLYLVIMDEAGEGWGVELDQNFTSFWIKYRGT